MAAPWFFIANALSLMGSSISMVAIPWIVLQISGDVAITSVAMALKVVPTLLSLFVGTHLFEKYASRTICIASDILSAALILSIPALYYADNLSIPLLIAIICAAGAVEQINQTSLAVMVPEIIAANGYNPEKFNGSLGSLHNLGDLLGPAIAGVIISLIGNAAAFVIDGMTFLASAAIFLFGFASMGSSVPAEASEPTPSWAKIKDGAVFIFSHPKIKYVAMLSITVNLLIMPLLSLVLPFLAQQKLGSAIDLGLLFSTFGVGTLIASLVFSFYGTMFPKKKLMVGCSTLLFVSFAIAGITTTKLSLFLAIFFVGLSVGLLGPLDNTILQKFVPEEKRGLIFLVYTALRYLTVPLSILIFGAILKFAPWDTLFFIMAAIVLSQIAIIVPAKVNYEAG